MSYAQKSISLIEAGNDNGYFITKNYFNFQRFLFYFTHNIQLTKSGEFANWIYHHPAGLTGSRLLDFVKFIF